MTALPHLAHLMNICLKIVVSKRLHFTSLLYGVGACRLQYFLHVKYLNSKVQWRAIPHIYHCFEVGSFLCLFSVRGGDHGEAVHVGLRRGPLPASLPVGTPHLTPTIRCVTQ